MFGEQERIINMTKKFSIRSLEFRGDFDESKRDECTISPQDAEREINESEWHHVDVYRDGGSIQVTTDYAIYWFGIQHFKDGFKHKPYVRKTIRPERKDK